VPVSGTINYCRERLREAFLHNKRTETTALARNAGQLPSPKLCAFKGDLVMWARLLLFLALAFAASPMLAAGITTRSSPGYGRCSKCECRRYEGNRDCCGNCGHNYSAHY
jgi:hypothetical protein